MARLLKRVPDAWLSISATTRHPREGEQDGVQYYFLQREEFERLIEQDGFLEWAEYSGNYYGTPLAAIRKNIEDGKQVILEIEVQGAAQVRERMPEATFIFIEPPSLEELEQRLRNRGTEDEETIQKRLAAAKVELSRKEEYDIQLVNDDLDEASEKLIAYVNELALSETRG